MSWLIALAILVTCASFFGESIFGFGGGLMSIPILSLLIGVREGVTFILIFQLLMGVLMFQIYKEIEWRTAIPMTIGLTVGAIIGTFVLSSLSDDFLRKLLATAIVVFLIKMIFLPKFDFGKLKNRFWGGVAGLLGGWVQGVIGTGGPVFTMYLSATIPQKAVFRATLIYLLFATSVVRIIFSIPHGLITMPILSLAAITLPFFLVAVFIGNRIHKRIPDTYYRYAIYTILSLSALSLLIRH